MAILAAKNRGKAALLPQEILAISQEISQTYAPVVSVKSCNLVKTIALTRKELCEINEEITRKYTPKINSNTTKLVLLPIDPEHLYVSWTLGNPQSLPSPQDTQALVLRIYPKPDINSNADTPKAWYDVAIHPDQMSQTVSLPKEHSANAYTATIGKRHHKDSLTVLATSQVMLPSKYDTGCVSSENNMFNGNQLPILPSSQAKSLCSVHHASGRGIN